MLAINLQIAHLNVRIECSASTCDDGIAALAALFPRGNGEPQLRFDIRSEGTEVVLTCNGEHIWRGEEAGEVVAAFEWAFYNRCIDAMYPRFVSLHAASVGWQGHGISFAGRSGAGKSSLCTAALLAGADYFSDEYSLLDEEGRIVPFPRPLQWGGETHPAFSIREMHDSRLFGEGRYAFTSHDGKPVTSLLWLPERTARQPLGMSLLVLPRFDAAAETARCEEVPRSQALMELAAEMHHKLPVTERLRELHRRIPDTTRIRRLIFPDARAAWRRIEGLLPGA